ncbi:MAG: hypothetical protein Kow00124_02560 [Anaerolineae bacterium]
MKSAPKTSSFHSWDRATKLVVIVLLFVLAGAAAYLFRVIFIPLIAAGILAYVLQPVVNLVRRITRLPRGLATLLVYLILLALLIPAIMILLPLGIEQLLSAQKALVEFVREINTTAGEEAVLDILGFQVRLQDLLTEVTAGISGVVSGIATGFLSWVLNAARVVVFGIFTFVIAFYLTRDADKIIAAFMGLIPEAYRRDVDLLLAEIDGVWAAFFRGMIILSLTVTVILTAISALLGLPNPLLLGIWGGLLEFIPSIGNMIWGLTALLTALIAGSSYLNLPPAAFLALVVIAYIFFSQLDINILIPNILGGQVRLHPALVLIGVIIGLTVGGVLGVALAAPVMASLRVLGRYVYAKLLDIDPFPMVGPPAAPPEERLVEAQRRAAEAFRPIRRRVGMLRRRSQEGAGGGAQADSPEASAPLE